MLGFLLRGCVGQGATTEEAIAELEENERVWLETAKEFGVPIPTVPERRLLDICYGMMGLLNK